MLSNKRCRSGQVKLLSSLGRQKKSAHDRLNRQAQVATIEKSVDCHSTGSNYTAQQSRRTVQYFQRACSNPSGDRSSRKQNPRPFKCSQKKWEDQNPFLQRLPQIARPKDSMVNADSQKQSVPSMVPTAEQTRRHQELRKAVLCLLLLLSYSLGC